MKIDDGQDKRCDKRPDWISMNWLGWVRFYWQQLLQGWGRSFEHRLTLFGFSRNHRRLSHLFWMKMGMILNVRFWPKKSNFPINHLVRDPVTAETEGVGCAEKGGAPLSSWPQERVARNAWRNFVERALYRIGLIALEIARWLVKL